MNSEINVNNDCKILGTVGIHRPNRTEWPEHRYIQVDENWQRNACIRIGLQFKRLFKCQAGDADFILTRPNKRALRNVQLPV